LALTTTDIEKDTALFKAMGSVTLFWKKWILLFSKDALN